VKILVILEHRRKHRTNLMSPKDFLFKEVLSRLILTENFD